MRKTSASHSGIHVRRGISKVETTERAAEGDSLLERAELRAFELGIQLLLADQYDLQQFAAAVLQVSQQPDLFQHIPIKIVGFIYDQHGGPAGGGALDQ